MVESTPSAVLQLQLKDDKNLQLGSAINLPINQFTFLVFRTHQGSQQTLTGKTNILSTKYSNCTLCCCHMTCEAVVHSWQASGVGVAYPGELHRGGLHGHHPQPVVGCLPRQLHQHLHTITPHLHTVCLTVCVPWPCTSCETSGHARAAVSAHSVAVCTITMLNGKL